MASLPVREMILYKHGVGFFVRAGALEGTSVELSFRQDEINDVLKSLTVIDQAGGQVQGIHYQTPMDQADRLATSSIRLSDLASVRSLVMQLRGRRVQLTVGNSPDTAETISGRLIGLDDRSPITGLDQHTLLERKSPPALVAILTDAQTVQLVALADIRSLTIHDEQAQSDLHFFLDTSMGDSLRQTITLRLSEGEHDLTVHYVAPSPVWRVSYRLVAESGAGQAGDALLQGWGLFDNRLEEDLNNVRVTLVAGQPISFIYDLYSSQIPQRPIVQDDVRIAPGPVEYGGAMLEVAEDTYMSDSVAAGVTERARSARAKPASLMPESRGMSVSLKRQSVAQATEPAAQAREAGELFQYEVTSPVTVKRGESALVPIISSDLGYARELLYNGAKLPDHPVAALRFKNTTGLTLERGPVTVIEDGDYKGEAVIPFTRTDGDVYVPFAVELGIRVTEKSRQQTENVGLVIENALLVFEEYQIQRVVYRLENTTAKDQIVTIEAPITTGYEPFDMPAPDAETGNERRWQVEVAAHARLDFVRKERQLTRRREDVKQVNYLKLAQLLKQEVIDQALFDRLRELLENLEHIQQLEQEAQQLERERDQLYQQQTAIRKNLDALQSGGQEGKLRSRFLNDLEKSQDQIDAIHARLDAIKQAIDAAEARTRTFLEALS